MDENFEKLLIIYLAIFGLDKRLSIIWLTSIPTIFVLLILYDWWVGANIFRRGIYIDLYMSVGGPITIVTCAMTLLLMLRNISNEEHEEFIPEEGNGDTGYDESNQIRGEQEEKK
jgi:hypothetical protein